MKSPGAVAFNIAGFPVMWYGVLISLGMILAAYIIWRRAESHDINPDRVIDFALVTLPSAIIGARIYYVLLNWDYYNGDVMAMINTRNGGLAIHGGLILGMTATVICCKKWKIRPLNALDLAVPAIALAQSIGRWGNFFNGEAYGSPTDLPWALNVDGQLVHPTFLYESIWTFGLFLFLSKVDKNRKFEGQVFFLYVILYSLERFFVEGLRTDSLMIGELRMAQIVSVAAFFIGIAFYIIRNKKGKLADRTDNASEE